LITQQTIFTISTKEGYSEGSVSVRGHYDSEDKSNYLGAQPSLRIYLR